MKFGRYFNHHK